MISFWILTEIGMKLKLDILYSKKKEVRSRGSGKCNIFVLKIIICVWREFILIQRGCNNFLGSI